MKKYTVRYYKRNPDSQDRFQINRETVEAENEDAAKLVIEACDCEVIDVEPQPELILLKHTPFDYTAAIQPDQPDPTDAAECADIQEWLGKNWDTLPPVEF